MWKIIVVKEITKINLCYNLSKKTTLKSNAKNVIKIL
jgi:hypothetical protein